MALTTLGINHQTADLSLREQIAFTPESVHTALKELTALPQVDGALILSTCNRTELYLSHSESDDVSSALQWLCQWHQVQDDTLRDAVYLHTAQDVVRHAIRVACGLDSMVLGEPEILGQFKQAWRHAEEAGTLGSELSLLTQYVFSAAKKVRSDTEISRNPVSLAHAAVDLTQQFFADLSRQRALVIGAGETAQLAARYLHQHQIGHLTIANRNLERAQRLAQELLAYAIPIKQLDQALTDADIVISGTSSPLPVLGKGRVERVFMQRRHRPIYMVDLAVPRDIEPEISELSDVYLYSLDDLHRITKRNLQSREKAREEACAIIDQQVEEYSRRRQNRSAFAAIREYRTQAQGLRDQTLKAAELRLKRGESPDEVLRWLATTLCNRLMHEPTQILNQAGQENDPSLLDAARRIFQITPRPPP